MCFKGPLTKLFHPFTCYQGDELQLLTESDVSAVFLHSWFWSIGFLGGGPWDKFYLGLNIVAYFDPAAVNLSNQNQPKLLNFLSYVSNF